MPGYTEDNQFPALNIVDMRIRLPCYAVDMSDQGRGTSLLTSAVSACHFEGYSVELKKLFLKNEESSCCHTRIRFVTFCQVASTFETWHRGFTHARTRWNAMPVVTLASPWMMMGAVASTVWRRWLQGCAMFAWEWTAPQARY